MKKHMNLDADESIFFSRELEFVKTKSYDIKYPQLKGRSLVPVSNEAGPGAETIVYEQYDEVGIAKLIASYADDLPRADVKGKEFRSPIKSLGASYGYSVQEIRAAQMAGKPLKQKKANAAKKAILTRDNKIIMLGDSATGLGGLLNNANVPFVTLAADGTGASTTLISKTSAQILRDLHKMANAVVENTKEVEIPDTMGLPLTVYNYIKSTPWSTSNDGKTILALFLEQSSYIKNVVSIPELKGLGAGATDRAIVYRKDPEAVEAHVPQDFEQFPEQPKGLEWIVPCHSRTGGVTFYYPLSAAYADGV